MELTRESARVRWLLLFGAWALMAVLAIVHARQKRDYVALLDALGRRGAAEINTPLQRPVPTLHADAQMWVRHALTLAETDAWRVRRTDADNAPFGREVHWNSAFAWLIVLQGTVRHLFTGEPLPLATEHALAWFNLPLLLGLMGFFSVWTARRAGAAAGVFVAFVMVCQPDFYAGFEPNDADHHGLLSIANFGVVLGALFMGAGWWRATDEGGTLLPRSREAAREGAILSAASGAIGLWISAASVLPAIPIVGGAGLIATWWRGRAMRSAGAVFEPALWRLWGRIGAAASLLFYLLEYFPFHLGWRLEVNHPVYALAWWGGSELVARLGERHLGLKPPRGWWPFVLPAMAAVSPLAIIVLGGSRVFVLRDPLMHQIAVRVVEGISLPEAVRRMGWDSLLGNRLPWFIAALAPALLVLAWRRQVQPRLVVGFAAIVCLGFLALGVLKVRFLVNTGGPVACLLLAAIAALTQARSGRVRYAVILGAAALLCLPARIVGLRGAEAAVRGRHVTALDALQPLYRDLAARLRTDRPDGEITLLTNPDASTGIGYYGRLKSIGTLYWENLDGMRAAAAMFSAKSLPAARALLQARRVSHVALISESNFLKGFHDLLHPDAPPDEWKSAFGYQLFQRRDVPLWLEELRYEVPADLTLRDLNVVLYRTHFAAPAAEQHLAEARTQVQSRNLPAAERAIDQALALDPTNAEIWVFKAELLLARKEVDPALRAAHHALARLPATHRTALGGELGNAFYREGAHAAAIALYRTSLETGYLPVIASNLGWLLATHRDERLRDGATALELAQRVARENPNSYDFVSTLAAALAENGRFEDAVAAATRALEIARGLGNDTTVARAEARLRTYEARQPWRQ